MRILAGWKRKRTEEIVAIQKQGPMQKNKTKMLEIQIQGMTCAHCEDKLKKALETVHGVSEVCDVNWKNGTACVNLEKAADRGALVETIRAAGYQATILSPEPEDEMAAPSDAEESCCEPEESKRFPKKSMKYDFDLLILGSGSAAFAATIKATELGKTVGLIEAQTVGGTCVNVGCVPSKTMIRAAESKHRIENTPFRGLQAGKTTVDYAKLVREKDSLVSHLREAKYASIIKANPNITLIEGSAVFLSEHRVQVGDKEISGDKILIATGSSSFVPNIPGLKEAGFLTSTSALELHSLPEHIVVLGGGYIALELSQMFARLGSRVTVVQRSEILFTEDRDVSQLLENYLRSEGIDILNHTQVVSVVRNGKSLSIDISGRGESRQLHADQILVATGRKPNTRRLNLDLAGVSVTPSGAIKVDSYCQTTQENVYAAGDVLDSPALVYVAAYEGNLAAENAFQGNMRRADYTALPWVIFTDPQISGVGLNEAQAKSSGIEYDLSILSFENVPRAIAARDTRGLIKLLRKTGTHELIGARIVAPEGSELLMEFSMIIKYKIPLNEVAGMFHPYLTLSEAVKLAAQSFDKDVSKLSCCAA